MSLSGSILAKEIPIRLSKVISVPGFGPRAPLGVGDGLRMVVTNWLDLEGHRRPRMADTSAAEIGHVLGPRLTHLIPVPILSAIVRTLRTKIDSTNSDPATLLFGRTRRRVLGWLLGHPDEAYYLRQIVRLTATSVGAVQRELELLTGAGLVQRRVQGRQVYFQANRDAPIFPELRSLFAKTAGLVDVLREGLASLGDRVQVAFVFGSAARGELRTTSDIDLLVVGEAPFQDVVHVLAGAQEQLGRDINPTVYPPDEFQAKLALNHHFLTNVLKGPCLFVIGGNHELVGLGAKR